MLLLMYQAKLGCLSYSVSSLAFELRFSPKREGDNWIQLDFTQQLFHRSILIHCVLGRVLDLESRAWVHIPVLSLATSETLGMIINLLGNFYPTSFVNELSMIVYDFAVKWQAPDELQPGSHLSLYSYGTINCSLSSPLIN